MEFAQRLKSVMDSKSVTMYRLAKELGVHQTTIRNWLDGKGEPRISEVQTIAHALGCDPYSLYSFEQASDALVDRGKTQDQINKDCERMNDEGLKLAGELMHLVAESPRYQIGSSPAPEGNDPTPPPKPTEGASDGE